MNETGQAVLWFTIPEDIAETVIPPDHRIVRVFRDSDRSAFVVEGPTLAREDTPVFVRPLLHAEYGPDGSKTHVEAWWEHAPEITWSIAPSGA